MRSAPPARPTDTSSRFNKVMWCKAVSCDHVKKRADIAKCWCHPDRGNRPVELVGASRPTQNGKDARTNLGHGVGQNRDVTIGVTASRDIWDKKAPHQPKRRSSNKNEPKAGLEAGSSMAPEPRGASSAPAHEGAEIERGDPGNRDPWRAEPQASRGEAPNGHPRHAHRNDHQEAPEHRRHKGTGARRGFRLGARRHDRRRHESAGEREEGERGWRRARTNPHEMPRAAMSTTSCRWRRNTEWTLSAKSSTVGTQA